MTIISNSKPLKEIAKVVEPNLGHPVFLKIDARLKKSSLRTDLLVVSNIEDKKDFQRALKRGLELVPILEYKWKLKILLERMKKEREEKKGLWGKIKGFFRRKKTEQKMENESNDNPQDQHSDSVRLGKKDYTYESLKKLKPRAFRGDALKPFIMDVSRTSIKSINHPEYCEYINPQKYLITHKSFPYLNYYYKVTIEFDLSQEILDFLERRNFVMFDIVQKKLGWSERINHHSIVISKQEWDTFSFAHATDLHLAERNDRIYGIVKKWTKLFNMEKRIELMEKQKDAIAKGEAKEEDLSFLDKIPLKKRFINPNNQFRKFIKIVNQKVLQNELDFVVLTGDLVDFAILSKLPKDERVFDYDFTNWRVFKEIILNLPQKKRKGMIEGEEILCPIFTIPGNHDYRPFHYDIRWAGMYRKLGLKLEEALAINDKLLALPITAIVKSTKALKSYWSEINPSLDYYVKLGKNHLVFINSGSDSWKKFKDLVTGHPSLTGLTNRQISYLENIVNKHEIKKKDNVFLFIHGPPINPKRKLGLFQRFKRKLGKKILTKIEEFRESLLRKIGKYTPEKMRIDNKFNISYGTLASNWEKVVSFCKEYCTLTLAGHTHQFKEFRLGDPHPSEKKRKPRNTQLEKSENPASVYFDLYSELYSNADDIEKFGPFVVQTPALGLGGYKNPNLAGGYRELIIKNGKLDSFKVNFV